MRGKYAHKWAFWMPRKKWYISLTRLFSVPPKCVYYDKWILLWSSGERNTIKINARETYIAFSFVSPCLKFWLWPHLRGWLATLLTVSPPCHRPCRLLALQGGRGPGSASSPQIQGLAGTPPAAKGGSCGGSMRCPHPSVAKGHTWQEIRGLWSQIFQRFTAIISLGSY